MVRKINKFRFLTFTLLILISNFNNSYFIQSNLINYPQVAENEEALKYSSYDFLESLKDLISNYSLLIESNYPRDKFNEIKAQTKLNSTLSKHKILSNLPRNVFIHSNYDIKNRLIHENIIEENKEIISFEILNHKQIIKNDNGHFSSHIVIIVMEGGKGSKLKLYDLYSNLIGEKEITSYGIEKLISFKNKDGNEIYINKLKMLEIHFYAITDNMRKIRKLKLSLNKCLDINETDNRSKIILYNNS